MENSRPRLDRFAWIVLALALALRVAVILIAFNTPEPHSGDGPFYIRTAQRPWLLGAYRDEKMQYERGVPVTSIGPMYPVYLIPLYNLIPDGAPLAPIVGARLGQAAIDTLTVLIVYLIAGRLFGVRVGRVALVAQALDVRYIFAAGPIASETLFIALFAAFMLAYTGATVPPTPAAGWGRYRLAGLLLGLAQLTRPVPLLYPAVLAVHAWLHPADRKRALRGFAWLLGVAALIVAPWMARTAYVTGEFTPIVDTVFVHFWRNARPDREQITSDEALAEAAAEDTGFDGYRGQNPHVEGTEYVSAGVEHIREAPLRWVGRIVKDTLDAYLQPYGTVILTPPGSGVKQAVRAFLAGEAPLGQVLAVPGLWRRALMYIWHYWALIGGATGAVLAARRRGWEIFPLAAWVVYVTGVTAPLLIEPRYLFPAMFALTILAAHASVWAWDALRARGAVPRFLLRPGLGG